ncbi:MAG: hypothetical protein KKC85_21740, partial [Gammaproteobacteria bacterium]|nr:hypothetical protein [Gammaproteobacteria bacterium]
VTALVMFGGAWIVAERAGRTIEYGDMTATLEIRLWPFQYLIAVMLAVAGAVHVWLAARARRLHGEAA